MVRLYLPPGFSVLNQEDGFILVSSLTGGVAKVNKKTKDLIEILSDHEVDVELAGRLQPLVDVGLLSVEPITVPAPKKPLIPFWNNAVTIFPTTDCNLRCSYCYSKGGEDPQDADPVMMRAAIDFAIESALRHGKDFCDVTLHGGGEPLNPRTFPTVQALVAYAEERITANNLKSSFRITTNGVLSPRTRDWLIKHFDHIQVSFDGPEDIQNLQRPTVGGGKSFPAVRATVEELERAKKSYTLRATVTQYSVGRMREILDLFHNISSLKFVGLERLVRSGRATADTPQNTSPDPFIFAERYHDAEKYAKSLGMRIGKAEHHLGGVRHNICGAAGRNFILTPEGDVTTCYQVCRQSDPRSSVFFIGAYDCETNTFVIDDYHVASVFDLFVARLDSCNGCFLQYGCASTCAADDCTATGTFTTGKNDECRMLRAFGERQINDKLCPNKDG